MISTEVREEVERLIREIGKNIEISERDGSILSNIEKLKNEPLPKFDSSPRFCDCLNCRLGKINQCQTFRPSKKGKRK